MLILGSPTGATKKSDNYSMSSAKPVSHRRANRRATTPTVAALLAASLVSLYVIDARAASWTTRPIRDVQAELTTVLGCEWFPPSNPIDCDADGLAIVLEVIRDDNDGTIARMASGVVIDTEPHNPAREIKSRETIARLLKYLFPEWKDSSAWLTKALSRVRASLDSKPTSIQLDGATVLVHWLETMQADIFAAIVVTKNRPPADDTVLRYSSICYSAESDELTGFRILLVRGDPWIAGRFPDRYHVIFQNAHGELDRTWVGMAAITAGQIDFEVWTGDGGLLDFDGNITQRRIVGTFRSPGWTDPQGNKIVFRLERVSKF